MPIFEYQCDACRHQFERLVRPGDTPACPSCGATTLTKQLSLPAIKSETTHDLAMRAAKKRDQAQAAINARAQREYELAHDD